MQLSCIHPPTSPGYMTAARHFHVDAESQFYLLSEWVCVRKLLLPASCNRSNHLSRHLFVWQIQREPVLCYCCRLHGSMLQEKLNCAKRSQLVFRWELALCGGTGWGMKRGWNPAACSWIDNTETCTWQRRGCRSAAKTTLHAKVWPRNSTDMRNSE